MILHSNPKFRFIGIKTTKFFDHIGIVICWMNRAKISAVFFAVKTDAKLKIKFQY